MTDIVLTSTQRSTLLALQQVTNLQSRTQTRLNTGKKVNNATDDAVAYFKAAGLSSRAGLFTSYKNNIDQSVQTINAALTATSSVETILNQLKGVLANVASNSGGQNVSATQQFKDLTKQIYQVVSDATYQGVNVLNSTQNSLSTTVSDRTAATLVLTGYNLQSSNSARALFTQSTAVLGTGGTLNFSNLVQGKGTGETGITSFTQLGVGTSLTGTQVSDIITNTTNVINKAISQIEGVTASLGTNVNILQDRSTFSSSYINTLQSGADALTLADLNTEAANSQALSLRQQLGIQSLTSSASQNTSILSLLRA